MSVTNIYLARHGETEYNRRNQIQGRGIDAPLNDTGRDQATAVAQYLRANDIQKIYSSHLKRSQQTAEIVANAYNVGVESHEELDEMNFGIFEGRPTKEIQNELADLHDRWKSGEVNYGPQGGESPYAVLARSADRIDLLIKDNEYTNLLFVLHGRLIRILLSHFLGYGLSAMHRIRHSNGALYHLEWDGKEFKPVYLHHTNHLMALELEN